MFIADWTDVTTDVLIDFDLETYPLEIKCDSAADSREYIDVLFYTADENVDDNINNREFKMFFGQSTQYFIYSCTDDWQYLPTAISSSHDDTWTITKTNTGLTVEFNGDEVANYLFSSSSNSDCVDTYNVEVTRIKFSSSFDTASDQYRAGTGKPRLGDLKNNTELSNGLMASWCAGVLIAERHSGLSLPNFNQSIKI